MCELELNNVRIQKIKVARISGTSTTWIGTGTKPVMVSGTTSVPYRYRIDTGTTMIGTGTNHVLVCGTASVPIPL